MFKLFLLLPVGVGFLKTVYQIRNNVPFQEGMKNWIGFPLVIGAGTTFGVSVSTYIYAKKHPSEGLIQVYNFVPPAYTLYWITAFFSTCISTKGLYMIIKSK